VLHVYVPINQHSLLISQTLIMNLNYYQSQPMFVVIITIININFVI